MFFGGSKVVFGANGNRLQSCYFNDWTTLCPELSSTHLIIALQMREGSKKLAPMNAAHVLDLSNKTWEV